MSTYRMVSETSKPMTGASNSLRAWWKRKVMFDKIGPAQIDLYYKDNYFYTNVTQVNKDQISKQATHGAL